MTEARRFPITALIALTAFVGLTCATCIGSGRSGISAAQEDVPPAITLQVVVVESPFFPSLDTAALQASLEEAAAWIERSYRRRVRFRIDRRMDLQTYRAELDAFGYVPESWLEDLYRYNADRSGGDRDDVRRFRTAQLENARAIPHLYSPESLRSLLPEDAAAVSDVLSENVDLLLELARDRIGRLEAMEVSDALGPDDVHYSYRYWDAILQQYPPEMIRDNVIIVNFPLLDSDYGQAVPHTLVRGGLLNGFAEVGVFQAIVSAFPVYFDGEPLRSWRTGIETETDRIRAIAYVIGHEVGAHGLMNYADAYGHVGCLTTPPSGFDYAAALRNYRVPEVCSQRHLLLDTAAAIAIRYGYRALAAESHGDDRSALVFFDSGLALAPENRWLADEKRDFLRRLPSMPPGPR